MNAKIGNGISMIADFDGDIKELFKDIGNTQPHDVSWCRFPHTGGQGNEQETHQSRRQQEERQSDLRRFLPERHGAGKSYGKRSL